MVKQVALNEEYTVSIFTENAIGLLARITNQFTKRHINIEALNVSQSEVEGVHRFTIVVNTTERQVQLITKQIEKQVEVYRCFYHHAEETIHQEIALYKLPISALKSGIELESMIRREGARILSMEENFFVIEKTGHRSETSQLFEKLKAYNVAEFVRSGRVAITKPMDELKEHIQEVKAKAAV
ncbi:MULTISPECIES: acetolactate synthase small subunit [Persicobacter]|uniref:Acetolactate synthase small subunit n=1 Tax=Persicobacter diffluens TaxID=981 RepID=A0AAN5AKF6_9BACT|nr:acetolactate synthase small subunit [Persicobacter sp. CCB-QB2]GJM60371.1 acetolactate synthase small subunit [Persicobacter diffluens]